MWTVVLLISHCIFFSASLFDFTGLTLQDPWRFLYFSGRPCEGRDGRIGVCMEPKICAWKGGVEVGSCQQGRRICCSASRSCGQTISVNGSYFINPEYPESLSSARACSVRLASVSDLCQVRLDFEDLILRGPDSSTGRCEHDALRVTGGDRNDLVPSFCGSNSGHHAYIEVYSSSGPLTLTVVTSEHAGIDRKWKIKITTIRCESPWKAPANCLQYYTGITGNFQSFNYDAQNAPTVSGGYPRNLNYAICFRKESGRCTIEYRVKDGSVFAIFNVDAGNEPTVNGGEAGVGVMECPTDYLLLGGIRYCGSRLNPSLEEENPTENLPVTDNTGGPFVVNFVTDSEENAQGFNLDYEQILCSSSRNDTD
ncbi:uncharacterized protein LOC111625895 [Centruroides sculpturatus]|uniref:uncharacterized protein LOC111625895 n=1 Tax=Centruroides sculpturatus TaxID=218467 RepID=UPI000C6E8B6A|nr:uncharacterized protein LOC111625895 [Centruroides sculpturatus]